jgi:hypothetical protein
VSAAGFQLDAAGYRERTAFGAVDVDAARFGL